MGVVESIRGVLWARKRQPGEVAYGVALAQERYQPDQLLPQAVAAEAAWFDAVCCSDHLELDTDPIAEPAEIGRNGADEVSDTTLKAMTIVSSDPADHVKKIRRLEKMGATTVVVMNTSGLHALGMIRTYGEHVLPRLREG
jgi:alkanesulfonate monooxygenase SsuD/methylene tetrahydromethanopterin reductase-like flavin-dependent oxidoreductase (luciferase family)